MGEQIVLSGATVAKIVGVLVIGLFATCLVVSAPERGERLARAERELYEARKAAHEQTKAAAVG